MSRSGHRRAWGASWLIAACAAAALSGCSRPQAPPRDPKDDRERYGYALGLRIADLVAPEQQAVSLDMVHQAIDDRLLRGQPRMTAEDAQAAIAKGRAQRVAALAQPHAAGALADRAAGEAYLAGNAQRKGVTVLPSGLQYEVLSAGEGSHPRATDQVSLHYVGRRIDGTTFDTSRDRGVPAIVVVDKSIAAWREILPMMTVGSRYRIVAPPALAFGDEGLGLQLGPGAAVTYDLELVSIVK